MTNRKSTIKQSDKEFIKFGFEIPKNSTQSTVKRMNLARKLNLGATLQRMKALHIFRVSKIAFYTLRKSSLLEFFDEQNDFPFIEILKY